MIKNIREIQNEIKWERQGNEFFETNIAGADVEIMKPTIMSN
jgi:hypothetical protein